MDIKIEPINFPEKNLWETNIKDNYQFINTIDEVVKLIKENNLTHFEIKDKFTPGDKITNILDQSALKSQFILRYTDEEHNLAISRKFVNIMNPNFFKQHESEIKQAFIEQAKQYNKRSYSINKEIFSDELLDILIDKEDVILYFEDVELTDEHIKKIQDKFLNAYIRHDGISKQISSMYVYYGYTKEFLASKDNILIPFDEFAKNNNLNLRFLKDNAVIDISNAFSDLRSDEEQLTTIRDELIKLDSLNKYFTIKFNVENRNTFNKLFQNHKFNNISLVIKNDLYEYDYLEYLAEEEKLNKLVKDIIDKNLSPFEKFIAVYNIVKNIKPYRENYDDLSQSRYLRFILDNEYIVCVGYAKLLVELLNKVGIKSNEYGVQTDISYDEGFTISETPVELAGHARVIINMDDDKYNIHGLYISDPTWDNEMKKNYFNNALLTFDKMQVNNRMFAYNIHTPILDIHNFNEYNEQINFLLKRKLDDLNKNKYKKYNDFKEKLYNAYKETANSILKTIKCDLKYDYFLKKIKQCLDEQDYIDFYTELGHYLLTRINKNVSEKEIFEANKEVLAIMNLQDISKETKEDYYSRDIKQCPYELPVDNNFSLEDRNKSL